MRRRNVDGYTDEEGRFRPIRGSKGYDPGYEQFARSGMSLGQALEEYSDVHDRKALSAGDDFLSMVPLDTFVRQQGGIKPGGVYAGEIDRLRNRESGTSGIVRRDGLSVHTMAEHAAEAGYIPWEYSDSDFLWELENVLSKKRNPKKKAAQRKPRAGETGHQPRMWIDGGHDKRTGAKQQSFQEMFEAAEAQPRKRNAKKATKKKAVKRTATPAKKARKRNPQVELKVGRLRLTAGASIEKKKNPSKRTSTKRVRNSRYWKLVNVEKPYKLVRQGNAEGFRVLGKFRKRERGKSIGLRRGYTVDLWTGDVWKKEFYEPNPKRKRTRKRNTSTPTQHGKTFKKFAGREATKDTVMHAPDGTPKLLDRLGTLVELKTDQGHVIKPRQAVWLCADRKGKLHLASTSERLIDAPAGSLGRATRIEYKATKSHLDGKPTTYFHKFGESDGRKPELISDGKGGLLFRGGNYRITSAGIVN